MTVVGPRFLTSQLSDTKRRGSSAAVGAAGFSIGIHRARIFRMGVLRPNRTCGDSIQPKKGTKETCQENWLALESVLIHCDSQSRTRAVEGWVMHVSCVRAAVGQPAAGKMPSHTTGTEKKERGMNVHKDCVEGSFLKLT